MVKPLGYIFGQTTRVYSNKLVAKFKENNIELSLDLFVILFHIDLNKDANQQFLANHLQKDKSVIMRQINLLIEKEYVVRSSNKEDKRKKNLVLTKRGNGILTLAKTLAREVSEELLSGIGEEDHQAFERVIDIILRNGALDAEVLR